MAKEKGLKVLKYEDYLVLADQDGEGFNVPQTDLKIENSMEDRGFAYVTVTFKMKMQDLEISKECKRYNAE